MPKKIDWNAVKKTIQDSSKKSTQRNKIDERFYTPKIKDDGTYEAIVRFIPAPDTDVPYAIIHNHFFNGEDGRVYNELCPTTIGEKCPVCQANNKAWEAGDQDSARARSRKFKAIANILIVKDPNCRENEGKVFLFKYDKKLHTKILEKMNPGEGSVDDPVMVFDWFEGCNFKLKIREKSFTNGAGKKIKFSDMDASEFVTVTSPVGSDEYMDEVESRTIPLKPFLETSNFLSYDDLQQKFLTVSTGVENFGRAAATTKTKAKVDTTEIEEVEEGEEEAPKPTKASKPKAEPKVETSDDEDEDDKSFFERLQKQTKG